MKNSISSWIFTVTLTIFAMLFGAGNLMLPLRIGLQSGEFTLLGFLGFACTGIILPMLGLLAIVAFEGSYRNFFGRLGNTLAELFIFTSMLIIGPMIAIPRIIMLSYEMLSPFLPVMSPLTFALIFAALVFAATFRPGKLLMIIGKILSPLKVITIITIILLGVFSGKAPVPMVATAREVFMGGFNYGYVTLDVLGSIFFGSIIVTLMTKYSVGSQKMGMNQVVRIAGISSIFAGLLLGGVYLGMTLLGAYHGHGLEHLNDGAIFSQISFRVLGHYGAAFIGLTVFLACFTTTVSLAAVLGEYIQVKAGKRVSYAQAVFGLMLTCAIVASAGLAAIMQYSLPFVFFFYPMIIVITLCNLAYKAFGFKFIKVPLLLTALYGLPALVNNILYMCNLCSLFPG
jgi:LIVCS family branched-chain amino acid:cation transporter